MSLLLFALLTCGAAASGVFAGSWLRRRAVRNVALAGGRATPLALPSGDAGAKEVDPLPTFALGLGDVLTRGGVDAVLAGAYVLREEGVDLAAVFSSIGPRGAPLVMAFPPPSDELFWLEAVEDESALAGPMVLEIGGVIVELARRLPVSIARVGEASAEGDPLGGDGTFFEYRGDGGRCAIVLVAGGARGSSDAGARRGLIAHGTVLSSASLDRLPGPFRAE